MKLKIATPGSPISTPSPGGTLKGLEQTVKLGIPAMELEWVQRVPENVEHVKVIDQKAKDLGIILTVHASYYINLNAKEQVKLTASKKRILDALTMAEVCGAVSVCVHPAFYLGMDPDMTYKHVQKATADIMKHKEKLFPHVNLAFETMGKIKQFGTLEEVLKLSKEFDIYPCVDIAHMHARSNGKWNSEEEFHILLDRYVEVLGEDSIHNVHFHYSGIKYSEKGERKHLPLLESDADWKGLFKVLKERDVGGVLVCESPVREEDVMRMMEYYERM